MAQYSVIVKGECVREEFTAAGTITPGHILKLDTAGKVVVHATASGPVLRLVALEDDTQGNDISDNYSSGDQVQCAWLPPGTEFYGLIADGQNIAIGDLLESNGAGRLQKYVAATADIQSNSVLAVAREAVDMSGSAGVDPSGRCRCQVI